MTDKNLTDKEIIKALECCANGKCGECPLFKEDCGDDIICKNALDLITRQKTENENLKVENQSLRSAANSLKMHYEEAQAEIERLKTELDFARAFRKETDTEFSLMHRKYGNMLKTAKAEAYKEFAEKAKEFMHNKFKDLDEYEFEYITERDIDNLVKEMVGENNDR
nr:MAG TPA: LysR family transcriptional regulator [Caudoviricetes sp.]